MPLAARQLSSLQRTAAPSTSARPGCTRICAGPPDQRASTAMSRALIHGAALLLLAFTATVVLLMTLISSRRNRHRAQLAEMRAHHAEEVRQAEREVQAQTLTEVSRELHDNIGQMLGATRSGVIALVDVPETRDRAMDVKDALDIMIAEVRRISLALNADRLHHLPLEVAIRTECERVSRLGNVPVVFTCANSANIVGDHKVVLFRIFQEAVNNAGKHAKATRIDVSLDCGPPVRLAITDNGRGFDLQHALAGSNGQGLANLYRRAEVVGGSCEDLSTADKGTTVAIRPGAPGSASSTSPWSTTTR